MMYPPDLVPCHLGHPPLTGQWQTEHRDYQHNYLLTCSEVCSTPDSKRCIVNWLKSWKWHHSAAVCRSKIIRIKNAFCHIIKVGRGQLTVFYCLSEFFDFVM